MRIDGGEHDLGDVADGSNLVWIPDEADSDETLNAFGTPEPEDDDQQPQHGHGADNVDQNSGLIHDLLNRGEND